MGRTQQLPDKRWRAFESEGTGPHRLRESATGRTERVAVREARKNLAAKVKARCCGLSANSAVR